MAKRFNRKAEVQKDLRKLITSISGFTEEDENFPLCVQFANSNIKYHRYLSPDSHKIQRAVDGLCEKFQVHSQGDRASDLKELSEQFLNQPGLGGKETGKTDVHYGMLSLLIDLANVPTQQDYTRRRVQVLPEEVDDFDWKAYLLEGEDLNFLSHASSESSEEEDLDSEKEDDGGGLETQSSAPGASKDIETLDSAREITLPNTSHDTVPALCAGEDLTRQLEEGLVVEYWRGKGQEETVMGDCHSANALARDWESYKQRLEPLKFFPDKMVVTETQVIREVLWMLSGVSELFVFLHDSQGYRLNPDVYVKHLTPESLESILIPLMQCAQKVQVMQMFVLDVVPESAGSYGAPHQTKSGTGKVETPPPPPQTYQAFAACVSEFLTSFKSELSSKERTVMKQETLITLLLMTSELQPWLQKVDVVHNVILHGVAAAPVCAELPVFPPDFTTGRSETGHELSSSVTVDSSGDNCSRATLLLDTLYQAVLEADLVSLTQGAELAYLLLNMLVESSRPMLEIVSHWINDGLLLDPSREFVLQRNEKVKSLDETFWEDAFVPRMRAVTSDEDSASQARATSSLSHSAHTGSRGKHPKNRSKGQSSVAVGSKLLQPILEDVILTGKSMEILESLGRRGEVLDIDTDKYKRQPTLYELFVEDVRKALSPKKSEGENVTDIQAKGSGDPELEEPWSMRDSTIVKQLNLPGLKDSLLNLNSQTLFSASHKQDGRGDCRGEPVIHTRASSNLSPLLLVCEGCLVPHVRTRYSRVCSILVKILKQDFCLMDCLHALQRYYLMSSGEVMHDFYTPLFQKIADGEQWREWTMLEMFLHDAVEPVFPDDISRLSVEVIKAPQFQQKSPVDATDCIQLRYNVSWPMNVIISSQCLQLYNEVFSFILQIKRVKCALDQLRFDDLKREQAGAAFISDELFNTEVASRASRIHQFQLLRFRLLYFVNSLHNYIMTTILHSTELEFSQQLEAATDLEQIIRIHGQYLSAIHKRCLLHSRLSMLKKTVGIVLDLGLTCSHLWRRGVDFASGESIQQMDLELTRCVAFLSSVLQVITKRGSYPHLESLAFALSSSPSAK